MALSNVTLRGREAGKGIEKPVRHFPLTFLGDAAYVAGGSAGFKDWFERQIAEKVDNLVDVISGPCGNYICQYDRVNDKLQVRLISTGAEAANGSLAATTFNITVLATAG